MSRPSLQERARQEYLATVKGRDEKALPPEIEELRAKKATEIEEARVRKERALKEEARGAALGGRGRPCCACFVTKLGPAALCASVMCRFFHTSLSPCVSSPWPFPGEGTAGVPGHCQGQR